MALAAREEHSPLADKGLVALGQMSDELVGMGRPGCRDDLLVAGPRPGVSDVFRNAGGEEDCILENHGELAAEVGQFVITQIDAVQQNLPG